MDARLKLAMRAEVVEDDGEKEKVSMCFCGGWPRLERFRDKMIIKCDTCSLRGEIVDEFDYDAAVHSWNESVKKVKEIFGGRG